MKCNGQLRSSHYENYDLSDGVVSSASEPGDISDHKEPDDGNKPDLEEEIATWATSNEKHSAHSE